MSQASRISSRERRRDNQIRILTHNIWGVRGDWASRRRLLVDGLRQMDPDVATLQETIVTERYDQVAELLGPEMHVVHSKAREEDGQGISIASRWPVRRQWELDLNVSPRTSDFACTTLIAELDAPASIGELLVVNHFPSYRVNLEYERELQAVIAARAIEEIVADRSMHVILAGDLDAEPDAASVRFLTGKQSLGGMSVCYRNAWESAHADEPAATFTTRNPLAPRDWPFHQIDHIFVRCDAQNVPTLGIAACELAFDEMLNGVWASDHCAVVADLTLPNAVG